MGCCRPCGCPIKINDTSVKAPIVVEPDPPVVEPDPPPVEMCVTYVFHPPTEQWVQQLVPCNELP